MRVGMVRIRVPLFFASTSFPHACGDGPLNENDEKQRQEFSPCVWGWSVHSGNLCFSVFVFPMRVGMVRYNKCGEAVIISFPHACGDGPKFKDCKIGLQKFSPCVWGWSDYREINKNIIKVFPMRVGMVRV